MEQITGHYNYPTDFYQIDSEDDSSSDEELFGEYTDHEINEGAIGLNITDESSGPDSSEDEEPIGEGLVVDGAVGDQNLVGDQVDHQEIAPNRPGNPLYYCQTANRIIKSRCTTTTT
jgi:hypothetical protein